MKNPLYRVAAIIAALSVCIAAFSLLLIHDGEIGLPGSKGSDSIIGVSSNAPTEETSTASKAPEEQSVNPFSEPASVSEVQPNVDAAPESESLPTAKPEENHSTEAETIRGANDLLVALRACKTPEDFAALGLAADEEILTIDPNILSYYSGGDFPFTPPLTDMYVISTGLEGMRYDQLYYQYSEDNDEASLALFNAANAFFLETYGESYSRHMTVGDGAMGTFSDDEITKALNNGVAVFLSAFWSDPFGQPGEEISISLSASPPGETQVVISYSLVT